MLYLKIYVLVLVRTLRPKPTVVVRRHRAGFVRVRASPQRTAAEILFRRRVGLGSDSEDSDEEYDIHAPDADPLSYLETLIEDPNAPDEYDVTYEYPPARVEPALPSGLFWHGRRAVTVHHLLQYPRWRGDAPVTVAQALSAAAHRAAADGSAAAIPLLRVAATTLLCYISNMNDVYLPQSLLDLTREFDVAPPPSLVVGAMARQDSLMQVLRALVDAFVRVGATVRSGEWRAPLIALTAVLLVNHFVNDLFDAEQATSLRAILVHVGSVPQVRRFLTIFLLQLTNFLFLCWCTARLFQCDALHGRPAAAPVRRAAWPRGCQRRSLRSPKGRGCPQNVRLFVLYMVLLTVTKAALCSVGRQTAQA